MDRRVIGVLLLIVVAVAAVIAPNIHGHRVIGTPTAMFIPPPPTVGDCVTSVAALPGADEDTNTPVAYPWGDYVRCGGSVIGEVMSIDPTAHSLAQATVGSYQSDKATCELSEVTYVGSIGPFDPATITVPGIAWQADVVVESISVGPSPLQTAAGQTWTACIGVTEDRSAYHGRIASALTTGVLPPVFATCSQTIAQQPPGQQVPCEAPHRNEILATTQVFDPHTTSAQVEASCAGLASRALRTADPTRGGRLEISAFSSDGQAVSTLSPNELDQDLMNCIASVPTPALLTGTLIGIGEKPLPIEG